MRILVTGSNGFLGKNLVWKLRNIHDKKELHPLISSDLEIWEFDIRSDREALDNYCRECNFVFHLAGVNRPKDSSDFTKGNVDLTSQLLSALETNRNSVPVMLASSIHATQDTPYGHSKKAAEDLVMAYARRHGMPALVYRFPNLFGKWSRPFYNSVVATFCYSLSRDMPIEISNPSTEIELCYIDDVVGELLAALNGYETRSGEYCIVPTSYRMTLGRIVELLESFRDNGQALSLPDVSDSFQKKLHATWLSFLPKEALSHPLKMHQDSRGSFTELFRTPDRGQFSMNITKPGITKGGHWHQTKAEKFIVVAGKGEISLHNIITGEIFKFEVCGDKMEIVEIPPGYAHYIKNTDTEDLVTLMWCNECFDSNCPDTISYSEGEAFA